MNNTIVSQYRSGAELGNRLAAECADRRGVAVALFQNGETLVASHAGGSGFSMETPVVVGCIAKCLTATLFANLTVDWRDRGEVEIADVLPLRSGRLRSALAGITIEDLLNHTHGLDDSDVETVPRLPDGSIDVELLCECVTQVPRIAEPGAVYSYGGVGSWLVAGLLEHANGQPYVELLRRYVSKPWGLEVETSLSARNVCAAWGGALRMSALRLLRFASPHAVSQGDGTSNPLLWLRTGEVAMPGWGPWQKAATTGWNRYGEDWLGHNGNQDGTGVALRFHRRSQTAIVVTAAREQDCFFALARLFGDVLEEFSGEYVRFPKPLDSGASASKELSGAVGRYENSRWRIQIEESPRDGLLRMSVYDRTTGLGEPVLNRYLRAAEEDVYMTIPAGSDYPYVQFVGATPEGHASYLWNGRQLWPRVS